MLLSCTGQFEVRGPEQLCSCHITEIQNGAVHSQGVDRCLTGQDFKNLHTIVRDEVRTRRNRRPPEHWTRAKGNLCLVDREQQYRSLIRPYRYVPTNGLRNDGVRCRIQQADTELVEASGEHPCSHRVVHDAPCDLSAFHRYEVLAKVLARARWEADDTHASGLCAGKETSILVDHAVELAFDLACRWIDDRNDHHILPLRPVREIGVWA